jgi:Raf kinase inhibitor-like YbhB/YbcL family protein
MEIVSSAFEPGAEIPIKYSCFGENLSPPLEWVGISEGTQSLALLVDDPDSEPPGFVHWVIYNIPPTATGLPEGVPGDASLADGSLQGVNDFAPYGEGTFPGGAAINLIGYDGPCPGNEHRYKFTLYALDAVLDLPAEATMAQVLAAMEGHVLAQAELIGLFAPP